ncbi:MAG: hypothetical protein U0237_07425 [Thermoleophilia bacterium]
MRHVLLASAALLLAPALAGAQDPVPGQITVLGTGSARVLAPEDPTETEIAQAVAAARVRAMPAAVDRAREVAAAAASAAGLPLGAILGVAEQTESLVPAGRFGPGRFCGSVRPLRTVTRDGRTTTVRGKARRVCVIPKSVTVVVAVAFRTTPPA